MNLISWMCTQDDLCQQELPISDKTLYKFGSCEFNVWVFITYDRVITIASNSNALAQTNSTLVWKRKITKLGTLESLITEKKLEYSQKKDQVRNKNTQSRCHYVKKKHVSQSWRMHLHCIETDFENLFDHGHRIFVGENG